MPFPKIFATELKEMVDFPLKTVPYLSDDEPLKRHEKAAQSEEHRWLVLDSANIFRNWTYIVNRTCFGVQGIYVASDYGMFKEKFYFVECLSPRAPIEAITNKQLLNQYAPLWFVLSSNDVQKLQHLTFWPNLLVLPAQFKGIKRRSYFLESYPSELIYRWKFNH